ncbi:hypothetical protein C7974DRAFT_185083 [Boeremia exigua]|uniref:uncharacterized protein n=1 Tax=Boeremia exigua TaxID=749465 RepID=UPI001E8D6ED5|nr:uncharacterized protein C7974DRAFT_185083 [Boeremia exigua]KAH6629356.1 hypothetical protein C7974DRAFT_185083 [Boeremia exigua]
MDLVTADDTLPSPPSSPDGKPSLKMSRKQKDSLGNGLKPTVPAPWADNTHDFSMMVVRATLRDIHEKPDGLVKSYNWYPDSVTIDSLFPPGIPLTAKEICVYYPHHIRWQDVMIRLSQNDYRGPDILGIQAFFRGNPQNHMLPAALNQIQRDAVQRLLPAFRTAGYEGEGDTDTYTDHLKPGTYLEKKSKGYVVPKFDDLLRGLSSLPYGEDTRELTQCLLWYSGIRSTFEPRLELNVLHAQALIRALRQPLEHPTSQNLNRLALDQWRKDGKFPKVSFTAASEGFEDKTQKEYGKEQRLQPRTRAVFNIDAGLVDLKMEIQIPIRHVLTFPFIALHSVVADAFQLGINNAIRRSTARADCEKTKREDAPQHLLKRLNKGRPDHSFSSNQVQTPKR